MNWEKSTMLWNPWSIAKENDPNTREVECYRGDNDWLVFWNPEAVRPQYSLRKEGRWVIIVPIRLRMIDRATSGRRSLESRYYKSAEKAMAVVEEQAPGMERSLAYQNRRTTVNKEIRERRILSASLNEYRHIMNKHEWPEDAAFVEHMRKRIKALDEIINSAVSES